MPAAVLPRLIGAYKSDSESGYNTRFIASAARMKALRSIRRDLIEVVKAGTFGNDFKDSPLR